MPFIFDPFAQAEKSPERARGGLGIGLTLVKRLVEMHHGTVTATSDGAGKGSQFLVQLPVLKGSAERNGEATPSAVGSLPPFRVLVVEDNRDAADMLNVMLKNWGLETEMAFDGPAAVEVANRFHPQIILLDIGLPLMNGYEVARRLRQQAWARNVWIIAVTGWGQEADRERSSAAGIDHHLIKPVEPQNLKSLLASLAAPPTVRRTQGEPSASHA
jgi:CheY-like chemotaxis protein